MKRILIFALISALGLTACTKTGAPGAVAGGRINSWTIPHVLRMTYAAEEVETLNPLISPDSSVSQVLAPLTMAYLVRCDVHNNLVPELTTALPTKENGGVSADGLTITYHLRKGVRWSDGAPFNADDVIFSFKAVLNPNNNVTSRTGFDLITKMDEPDKYTVVLHMKKPYASFVETFFSTSGAEPSLLPVHLLGQYPNLNRVAYNSQPVGIGPFKVKIWQRGQRVVLVPNPYYFRGLPKLKEIDDEIIPDVNTALTAMQSKSLDMSYNTPQNYYPQLMALNGFDVFPQDSYIFRHFDFNLTSPKLSDPIVREALRYGMDRPTILAKLYHGIGNLQDQPAIRVSPYWDPNIKETPFDLNKANQLLDADGWKRGPDGIRAKNGVRLDLNFATAAGTVINDQLIELVRQTWKQLGVNITTSHYQNTLLFGQYQDNGILARGKFDVAYFAWGQDGLGDMSPIYGCDEVPPSGQNYMHWCNATAQRSMNAFFTHFEQAQRNADDAVVLEQLNKDLPTIVLMGTKQLWVYNKDLKNFHPGELSPFDNFMDVDI